MPLYMDVHFVPGIEAKHAAEAHREDIKVQEKHNCRCLTYWVDEARGNAFCLIDAPDEQAVRNMHAEAHGLVPGRIIRVNSNVVEAFLGRITNPEGCYDPNDPELKVFNDPAFRVIQSIYHLDEVLLGAKHGLQKAKQLVELFEDSVSQAIIDNEGRRIESLHSEIIISFMSVSQAMNCAAQIQKTLHIAIDLLECSIGIDAGLPVDKADNIFGQTIDLANVLAWFSAPGYIYTSSIVKDLNTLNNNITDKDKIIVITVNEEEFIRHLFSMIDLNLSNQDFSVEVLAEKMATSKSGLYRSCTQILNRTPNQLIKELRLLKAIDALKTDANVTEVSYATGFSSSSYFTKCFQEVHNITPTNYKQVFMSE